VITWLNVHGPYAAPTTVPTLIYTHHSAEGLSTLINTDYSLMASIIPRPPSHTVLQR